MQWRLALSRNKGTFLSNMTKTHVIHNQQGGYIVPCKECDENMATHRLRTGCLHHTSPLLLHVINLSKSQIVKDSVTKHLLTKYRPN